MRHAWMRVPLVTYSMMRSGTGSPLELELSATPSLALVSLLVGAALLVSELSAVVPGPELVALDVLLEPPVLPPASPRGAPQATSNRAGKSGRMAQPYPNRTRVSRGGGRCRPSR